jgi:hypothetical protein
VFRFFFHPYMYMCVCMYISLNYFLNYAFSWHNPLITVRVAILYLQHLVLCPWFWSTPSFLLLVKYTYVVIIIVFVNRLLAHSATAKPGGVVYLCHDLHPSHRLSTLWPLFPVCDSPHFTSGFLPLRRLFSLWVTPHVSFRQYNFGFRRHIVD